MRQIQWNESEHPRSVLGRFVKKLQGDSTGGKSQLQDGSSQVSIRSSKDMGLKGPNRKVYVVNRDPGERRGRQTIHDTAEAAAKAALEHSAMKEGRDTIGPGRKAYRSLDDAERAADRTGPTKDGPSGRTSSGTSSAGSAGVGKPSAIADRSARLKAAIAKVSPRNQKPSGEAKQSNVGAAGWKRAGQSGLRPGDVVERDGKRGVVVSIFLNGSQDENDKVVGDSVRVVFDDGLDLSTGTDFNDIKKVGGSSASGSAGGWTPRDQFDLDRARKALKEAKGPSRAQSLDKTIKRLEAKKAANKPADGSTKPTGGTPKPSGTKALSLPLGEGPKTHTGWLGRYRKMSKDDLLAERAAYLKAREGSPATGRDVRLGALNSAIAEASGEKSIKPRPGATKKPDGGTAPAPKPKTQRAPGLHITKQGKNWVHEVVDRDGNVTAKRVSPTRYSYARTRPGKGTSFHTKDPGGSGVRSESSESLKAHREQRDAEERERREKALGDIKPYVSKANNDKLTFEERRKITRSELERLRKAVADTDFKENPERVRVLNGMIRYAEADLYRLTGRHAVDPPKGKKETFHVFAKTASGGQHRFVKMATSAEEARKLAEADGHKVEKVRRAPTPPADNLARKGAKQPKMKKLPAVTPASISNVIKKETGIESSKAVMSSRLGFATHSTAGLDLKTDDNGDITIRYQPRSGTYYDADKAKAEREKKIGQIKSALEARGLKVEETRGQYDVPELLIKKAPNVSDVDAEIAKIDEKLKELEATARSEKIMMDRARNLTGPNARRDYTSSQNRYGSALDKIRKLRIERANLETESAKRKRGRS